MTHSTYQLQDLLYLMARLRDPQYGCPWDLKQDYRSIVPATLEEVYEVVEAIEREDLPNLKEELGDLLFQVVFYSQLASEDQHFDLADVVHGITAKLLRRHPHVFPSGNLYDAPGSAPVLSDEALHAQWEQIKQSEKQSPADRQPLLLEDVPMALPALQRAYKLQKKMASVGFDWQHPEQVFPVVREELAELEQAVSGGVQQQVEEELGDVLFAVINLCRHLHVEPEQALRKANRKVEQRFALVEQGLQQQGKTARQASVAEMETLWQAAKRGP